MGGLQYKATPTVKKCLICAEKPDNYYWFRHW